MKKITFYDNCNSFGGHHITAIDAVKYLVEKTDASVSFVFSDKNSRLYEKLNILKQNGGKINLYPMQNKAIELKNIGVLLAQNKINELKKIFDSINPDIIISLQGSIEQSTLGLIAAKKGKYKAITFIALTHKISAMQGKLGWLRDILNLYFYRMSDGFITISDSAKSMLERHGVKSKISVVYCGADLNKCKFYQREESRRKYHIDEQDYVVALIGRIQFVQKGHDILLNAISEHRQRLRNIKGNIKFFIVGDGPDGEILKSRVKAQGLEDIVTFVPWENNLSHIYSAIDMVIIPSRFEGIPIVMLEAMYYGLPIVASNVDGMAELLPQEWLFKLDNTQCLIETMLRVKGSDNTSITSKNKSHIMTIANVEKFGIKFYEAICEQIEITSSDSLTTPKVSVIIPAYNAMNFLPQTVESVLNQTFTNFELLIVNDGSKDNIKDWYENNIKDPRVKLISQENKGLSAARNLGIAVTKGEYIAFLDADDLWKPKKLEKQVRCFEKDPKVGLVYTWTAFIDEFDKPIGRIISSNIEGNAWEKMVVNDKISNGSSAMVRRICFDKVGLFDSNVNSTSDRDMWIRIAEHYSFAVVKEPLTLYRRHSQNMTNNYKLIMEDLHQVFEKTFKSAPIELQYLRSRCYAWMNIYIAWLFIDKKDYKQAIYFRRQALLHYPFILFSNYCLRLSLAILMMRFFGCKGYDKIRSFSRFIRRVYLNIYINYSAIND
jgi:glycosyltransferase involved in cell wall biosynthesis